MSLTDQHPSMMDGLGQPALEDLRLQPPLQEILNLEGQHVIQPHALFVQHADTDQSTNEGVSFEETFGVLGFEFKEFSSGMSDLGEG